MKGTARCPTAHRWTIPPTAAQQGSGDEESDLFLPCSTREARCRSRWEYCIREEMTLKKCDCSILSLCGKACGTLHELPYAVWHHWRKSLRPFHSPLIPLSPLAVIKVRWQSISYIKSFAERAKLFAVVQLKWNIWDTGTTAITIGWYYSAAKIRFFVRARYSLLTIPKLLSNILSEGKTSERDKVHLRPFFDTPSIVLWFCLPKHGLVALLSG